MAADTHSPEYRLECEARYLLRLPLAERREAMARPARAKRLTALRAEMTRQWQAAQKKS